MANTRETMGEQACLDALVANTLTSFEDDGVTKVGANCLSYHTALTDVKLPQCKSVEAYGLAVCTALTTVDMLGGSAGTIAANAFNGDTALAHLILRGGSKTTLASTNAFNGTPISLGNGAIYVPSDQLAAYKADTNWKNYFITTTDRYPLSSFDTIEDSWDDIIAATQSGTYQTKYAVGDTKSLTIGNHTYKMMLVAKNADIAEDGVSKVATTWLSQNQYAVSQNMSGTPFGWPNSNVRAYLSSTVLPLLPANLQAAIKPVVKQSTNYDFENATPSNLESVDKLWIPSLGELSSNVNVYEKTDLYYSKATWTPLKTDGTKGDWWLRSMYERAYSGYAFINTSGTYSGASAGSSKGVVFGFCI